MRVLITADVVGGVWRYTVALARELTLRGHSVAVAVVGDPGAQRLRELPPEVETFQRELRLEWMPGGLDDVAAATAWLAELAGDWRADVVHLNQLAYSADAFPVPVVVVAHSDVLSWFEAVRRKPAPGRWADYQRVVGQSLATASMAVAPTAYQACRIQRHYGRAGVRVIHNGIEMPDTAELTPASARPLVLVAGRAWDQAKGVALLDRAVGELGADAPSVHLVGPLRGPAGERLELEHVVAQGEVDGATMDRFYCYTRLYVGPSLYEPFGLTPLEAAAHGCGLLLSGIGSFRELWADAAAFFEPLTATALAESLRSVLAQPELLEERAARSLALARQRYTAARMADDYEALYQELRGAVPDHDRPSMRPLHSAS